MNNKVAIVFTFLSSLFLSKLASASMLDLNLGYVSDTFSTTSDVVTTRMNYDFALGIHLGSKKNYFVALSYGSLAATDQATTTTTLTSQDTGLKFGLIFGKSRTWSFSGTYNFIAKAAYKAGAASEVELRGTSLKADFGYSTWISEAMALAFKLVYFAPSYSEKVSGTTLTAVAYSRVTIMPCMNLYLEY